MLDKLRQFFEANGLGNLETFVKEVEDNTPDVPRRNFDVETWVPIAPRFFWLDARRSFVLGDYVGSVLLCSMAVETAVRCLLGCSYLFFGGKLDGFLEELDFRKSVRLLRDLNLIDKTLYDELQDFYSTRTWYSHVRFSSILGKDGEEEVEVRNEQNQVVMKKKIKDDEMLRTLFVQMIKPREHALEAMRFVESAFDRMFRRGRKV